MNKKPLICLSLASLFAITGCQKPTQTADIQDFKTLRQKAIAEVEISAHGKNTMGFSRTNYLKSLKKIVERLKQNDIQVINEGHRITLIVPTDKYYIFDTSKLNDLKYGPLADIYRLIKCFPHAKVYVGGFTDEVGSKAHRRQLSQDRAQAMVAYLWSHGISETKINAEGYLDRYTIGNNQTIHGSAFNRRVEVQWSI